MSAVAQLGDRPSLFDDLFGRPARPGSTGREPDDGTFGQGGEAGDPPTLDRLLAGVWETLGAHATAACPVCGELMEPEYAAHARPIGGRCSSCGSTLR